MAVNRFIKKPFPTLREFPYEARRWCVELQERLFQYTTQLETTLGLTNSALWVPRTPWVPTVTQSGAFTEDVEHGVYIVSNGWCFGVCRIEITLGTGTGGQRIQITPPVEPDFVSDYVAGTGEIIETGVANHIGMAAFDTPTAICVAKDGLTNYVGATPNFALAAGDFIMLNVAYPIAL